MKKRSSRNSACVCEPTLGVDPNEVAFSGNRLSDDFQNLNRNERALTLNLKIPEGLNILNRLLAAADGLKLEIDRDGFGSRKAFQHRTKRHFLADTTLLEAAIGLPHDLALALIDLDPA